MAGEPCESIREQAWWPFGGNVADQNSPSRVQLGLDLAEHPDSSRELWNVAVATPGEDEGVKAPRQLDGLDRARVELRRQTFLVEHVAGVGDSTRGDVEPLDPIAQLEQADQIAPRAGSNQENAICGLQKACVQPLLPGIKLETSSSPGPSSSHE